MTDIGHAAIGIYPSFDGIHGKLERGLVGPLGAAGVSGGSKFGDTAGTSAGKRFGSTFSKLAKASLLGIAGAGALAAKFGADAIGEARDAAKVGKLTEAVIKSTGAAAKVSADDVGKLSERLSNMAGLDDEMIQSGANTILTFTKIRNEAGEGNKIFDRATLAALNMSAALGKELSGASIQVGKALNDPIKGVTALSKAGVQFSEDQKLAIKAMVESGDTLGAQKVILKELDTQFKGAARSQANEAGKLQVEFGNLKEEIGTELLPVMDDLAIFLRKKGIPAVRDFAGWVKDDAVPAIKDFADDAERVAKKAKPLVDLFNDLPTAGKIASLGGALAGGLVVKHQLGKIFERGGAGNPMFVVVTNPGAGITPDTTPDGKPKPGRPGIGAGTAATLAAVGLPLLDDQYKNNPILTTTGDWAERMGNKLGLPNWFAGDTAGEGRPNGAPTPEQSADMQAKLQGFYDGTLDLGGGKASPDLKRLADGFKDAGDKAWGAGKLVDGFTGATRGGRRDTDRLRESLEKVGLTTVRPQVDTSSIQAALALFRQLPGMEGVVGPVDPSLLPTSPRAGVTFTGPINVKSNTPREFATEVDRRTRARALGGRG